MMKCWQILGIEPTHDLDQITHAYENKIALLSKTDNSGDIELIGQAYNQAIELAQQDAMMKRELAIENEPDKEQAEENTSSIVARFIALLNKPDERNEIANWQHLTHASELNDPTVRHKVNDAILPTLLEIEVGESSEQAHSRLPQPILALIANRFNWLQRRSDMYQIFNPAQLDVLFVHTFGNKAAVFEESEKASSSAWLWRIVKLVVIWFIVIRLMMFGFDYVVGNDRETTHVDATPPSPLLVCNKITKPDESDEFAQCKTFAEEGHLAAQMRLAWLYSQSDAEDSWQKTFDWAVKASNRNQEAALLTGILLYKLGDSENDIENGKARINAMMEKGFKPADAYLASLYLTNDIADLETMTVKEALTSSHRVDPDIVPFDLLVSMYASGITVKADRKKAVNVMEQLANRYFPQGTNAVAWFLATLENNTLTGPEFALELAQRVIDHPQYENSYAYIDTAAAAMAAAGQFEKAIETQQKANAILAQQVAQDASLNWMLEEFESRLSLYQNQQAYTEYQILTSKQALGEAVSENIEELLLETLQFAVR
ncbi:hypothetical protein OE749_05040 [Aestuariibacter sp. AA17]|uniref:J domain-containing protein n=1 Tax=Fluctibacter corallii TaxID=2984329 RepID=A0ABT3A5U7_9ALTE|nr:hypothetical protein [Aestuariibacter sp. AA17]MCV2884054.1 hypothetical protein [Aestuariibacter sp. AA17]